MQEKLEDIKYIQNTIWGMYKDFLLDHSMKKWNDGMQNLVSKYVDKGDAQLFSFVQNLLITWSPIIAGFSKEFNG